MLIRKLEHYNVRTARYDETIRFYVDVLGMTATSVPGMNQEKPSWIVDGSGVAAVHLIVVDPEDPAGSLGRIMAFRGGYKEDGPPVLKGSGAIDHIAFQCEGYEDVVERLRGAGLDFHENAAPQVNLRQIFVDDPNGVTLELNFR
jgi:catechol 2,3-dioxygenase-like lactoylglutathione lyase family enzyme